VTREAIARVEALTETDVAARPATGRRGRIVLLAGIAAFVLALDVVTKSLVAAKLAERDPIRLLGGLVTLRVVRNGGAAFGIGVGLTALLTLVAATVVVVIVRSARQLSSTPWAVALGLLLGGALGNLTDRLLRSPGPLRGQVVDFIELPHWPVFNVADSGIVVGGILMVLLSFLGRRLDGQIAPRD
jgi:signal peptidase II